MLYFTLEAFRHLANQNCVHQHGTKDPVFPKL